MSSESTSSPNVAAWRKPRGASACAVPGSPDFARFMREVAGLTGGHGVDCIFITAGGDNNSPVELAAELARDRARVVDIGKCKLDLPWNAYYEKELDVRFSRSYGPGRYDPLYEEAGIDYPIGYVRWTERRNMECILDMLREGRLDLAPLINQVFPFESAVDVYERMNKEKLSGLGILFKYAEDAPVSRRIDSSSRRPRGCRIVCGSASSARETMCRACCFRRSRAARTSVLYGGGHQHRAVRRERGQEIWVRPVGDGQRRPFGGRRHRRGADRHAPRDACRAGLRSAPRGQGRFCREAARDHAGIARPKSSARSRKPATTG